MLGKVIQLQCKLARYVDDRDCSRVADYLVVIAATWPDLNTCPIDRALLSRSADFLRGQGWTVATSPEKGLSVTDPQGARRSSHRDGQPKPTLVINLGCE